VSGGVACVVGIALLAVALPELRNQRAADEPSTTDALLQPSASHPLQ
jgi:hypothetical protein